MQHLRSLSGRSGKRELFYLVLARDHPFSFSLLAYQLRQGFTDIVCSAIFDETKPQIHEPIVQCVQIKPLPPQPNHQERYRAVFSDISNYVQTMLATRE